MNTPEQLLLRFFMRDRENYNKYFHVTTSIIFDKEISTILKTIEQYYNTIEHHNYISFDEFTNFFNINNSTLKDKESIITIAKLIYDIDVSDSLILEVIKNMVERDTCNKIVQKLLPVLTENKFGVLASVDEDIKSYLSILAKQEKESPFDEDSLDELLEANVTGEGLSWRLQCLQDDLGILRQGLLGHVFARVETGKSSFLASELSYMAGQLKEDENIIWFCNEESTGRLKLRLYSAILNSPMDKILNSKDVAIREFNKRGGNKIKLIGDATNLNLIRNICFEYKPKLIVIDSGDKVSFPGDKGMEGPMKLKELYWRYRQLANEFNTTCITVGQACAEAAGKKWIEMHHMDYSKTGKPAELDFAIGIGKLMDDEDGLRYINIPKNKLHNGTHGRHTCKLDTMTARYSDI